MSFSKTPIKKQLLPFQQQNVAANQHGVPLPYLAGTRLVALNWITPALNEITHQSQGGGKKGGGGGGKKSGGANQSLDYYGTLGGAISWGPLDWFNAVIGNGNYLFQGNLTLTTDVTDLTGSILDPTLIAAGGYLKLMRGTETQPADAALAGHPPYKGTAGLIAHHIFFGQNSGTAPNLQVIAGRLPRVDPSIVAPADNIADDGQVNPIACLAEILTDERGRGLDISKLDAASWLAAAHWCAQDQAHRDYTFCSPLFTQATPLREIVKQLLDPFDGFCRWTAQGKLACNIYEWGVDPGGLPTFDAQQWIEQPQFELTDWTSVPTEVLVTFTDRAYEFQTNSVIVPNARAQQVRQLDDPQSLNREHTITRITQAHRQGVEYNRRIGTAPCKGTGVMRLPFLTGLSVGSKIKINSNPEPGGGGLAQLARIEKITRDRTDKATIELVTDNLLPATAYTPTWTVVPPSSGYAAPLVHFLGVPLPPTAFGLPLGVALLATRSAPNLTGFEVYFGTSDSLAFADLGQQAGFATRASLYAGIGAGDATAAFTELDGLSGPEAGLAANTPGGNTVEAANDVLLALIAQLDGNGRITLDGSGNPIMEFVSIVNRATAGGLPAATFNYSILRGRQGTSALAWGAGAVVWIVPRLNLTVWRHALMPSLAGAVALFRLVSFTSNALDESLPIPECGVNMLPITSPDYVAATTPTNGPDDGVTPNMPTGFTANPGLGLAFIFWNNATNTAIYCTWLYYSTVNSLPAQPQAKILAPQTFFPLEGLTDGETVYVWLQEEGVSGRRSAIAGPFTATSSIGLNGLRLIPGSLTAPAVGTNLLIAYNSNLGLAIINDANIVSLTAAKITAGILNAMQLKAGYMATDYAMFNPAYGNGSTFPSVAYQNAQHSGPDTNLTLAGKEFWLFSFYGWATGSGFANNRFGKAIMAFLCMENGGCTPTPTGYLDLEIIFRVNGGATTQVTPYATRAVPGNGSLNAVGGLSLSGLNGTDVVDFGVRAKAPNAGDQLNVANLTVTALNF